MPFKGGPIGRIFSCETTFHHQNILTMRRFLPAVFSLLALAPLAAQKVTYIMFNRECMTQLEYRYTYSDDDGFFAYSIRPNGSEQYLFNCGNDRLESSTRPEKAVACRDLKLNGDFVESVNERTHQAYIVFQRSEGGYWLLPVSSATQVTRNGAIYYFRGQSYAFAADTSRLENDDNLAASTSPSAVYATGINTRECVREYAFRRVPRKSTGDGSDFEFVPGIGITSDRTGATPSKAMGNEYKLVKINAKPIDEYLATACGGKRKQRSEAISRWTPPTNYTEFDRESPFNEDDKEKTSIAQKKQEEQRPVEYDKAGLIRCPDPIGEGYHLVQPGDNLMAISRTYKVPMPSLVKWNKLKSPDRIEVCQKIWYTDPSTAKKAEAVRPVEHSSSGGRTLLNQSQLIDSQDKKAVQKARSGAERQPSEDYYGPALYDYDDTNRPKVHIVKRGEYLLAIAKKYGCAEECIRMANNMRLDTRDVDLDVGEKIVIPDRCDECDTDGYKPKGAQSRARTEAAPRAAQYDYSDEAQVTYYEAEQRPKTHTVKRGETLSGIATKYRCKQSCIRMSNNMSLDVRDVEIYAGESLKIPENCNDCDTDGYEPRMDAKATTGRSVDAWESIDKYERKNLLEERRTRDERPAQYDTYWDEPAPQKTTEEQDEYYRGDNYTTFREESVTDEYKDKQNKKRPEASYSDRQPKVQQFLEHVVKQGETLNTVATRYKADPAEIVEVNGLDRKEPLVGGRRLLIPVKQ
jgi:LysM repeat protein